MDECDTNNDDEICPIFGETTEVISINDSTSESGDDFNASISEVDLTDEQVEQEH